MKHIYTFALSVSKLRTANTIRLVFVLSLVLLISRNGFGQTIESISPSCVMAGGGSFTLTVVGSNFNGSSYITLNGSEVNSSRNGNTLTATIPATTIANAGIIEVRTTRANGASPTAINLVVLGTPTATSVASCGQTTLTASGAPTGAIYRWYSQANGGAVITTGSSYATATAGQYYVSMAMPGACESARRLVTATVNAIPTIPQITNSSRCGNGALTLSASGAVAGQDYRWYSVAVGGTAIATGPNFTTPSLSIGTRTYYVSKIAAATGCESTRVPVTATVNPATMANTEFVKQSYEVGKPGIIRLNSDVIDRGHAVSIKWQAVNVFTGAITELGVTEAPEVSPASFQVQSMPGGDTYFQATIVPVSSVCYFEPSLVVTSQDIVSLPVELVSFKGQSSKGGVQLSWKTASERDNRGFEVEVSADGKSFRKVAFVESKVGTTSLMQNYSYLDAKATAGTTYYRLKQVDFDGAFEYSKTVVVTLTQASSSAVYPTLATSDITVKLTSSSDDQVTIAVADMAGKQLLAVQNPIERQVVLPVQQLQQGIYFVTVVSGNQKEVFRIVKR